MLPALAPADARPRRSHHDAGRQGPSPVSLDRSLLPLRRRAGMRRAHPRHHGRRQTAWRPARRTDRPRAHFVPRAGGAARILRRRRDRRRAGTGRRPGRDRRHHRQCRRRRAFRQYDLPAPAHRARRAGRRGRADLGPDRGAVRLRRRRRRAAAVSVWRQDRTVVPPAGRWRNRRDPLRAERAPALRRRDRAARRCRVHPHGWPRGRAHLHPRAGDGHGPVLELWHRPVEPENPRGQIEPALLRVVLSSSRAGDLRRRRRRAAARLPQAALGQNPAADLAARCGDGTAAHHLTRSASAWPNSCKAGPQSHRGIVMKTTRRNVLAGGLAAAALTSGPSIIRAKAQASAARTVKAVMHADLRVLDPIWTTANITTAHGAMIYDTLFGLDANFAPHPQMVDKWGLSDDKLTYTFTLRDGLKFSDGAAVTAADCVASVRRWAARSGAGQTMMARVKEDRKSTRLNSSHTD